MDNPILSLPPQPEFMPGDPTYNDRYNAWAQACAQALETYKTQYAEAMRQQGVTVTFENNAIAAPGSPYALVPTYTATLTRDGFSTDTTISLGRAQQADAYALASFDQNFALKFQAQVSPNPLPSAWYQPPASSPGPAPTVPIPQVDVIAAQAPATPNSGTLVTSPTLHDLQATATTRRTFWEWNWFYEQASGRSGPSPEEVGVSSGNDVFDYAGWWAKVSVYYGGAPATGVGTPTPGGGGSTGGGTPTAGGGTTPGGIQTQPPLPDGGRAPTMKTAAIVGAVAILAYLAGRK